MAKSASYLSEADKDRESKLDALEWVRDFMRLWEIKEEKKQRRLKDYD